MYIHSVYYSHVLCYTCSFRPCPSSPPEGLVPGDQGCFPLHEEAEVWQVSIVIVWMLSNQSAGRPGRKLMSKDNVAVIRISEDQDHRDDNIAAI